ncbi:MgtC/SapB family protein [Tsukamurella tyrosinosolvens]|uniref:MgtC/SapB family protein n=1 Tax=Tsukamurella tyrosinosolvens TaxID=57704 RepID=UPI000C7EA2C2|nr:DUF4010 domain-containing protein [Tsukamurella tyrosinosolvens]AUN43183.1 hypothetical protein ASU32_19460 [Tsukamurella tyrosinosolvens]
MSWDQVEPFVVALAAGLLIGLERERSDTRELPAGSRSFALLALFGAVAASLGFWAVVVGLAAVMAIMVVAYFRSSEEDVGSTTEIAAMLTYVLGALAYTSPAQAVALAVVVAGLLVSKARIHHFARQVVTGVELEDAIKFFVVAFVVLPLLPDRGLGPYGVLNPAKVWLVVVLLTGISWTGYIAVRALGPERGLLVTGLAGGFVSATATTASMGRLSRSAAGSRAPLAGALVASLATFVQLLIVIAMIDAEVVHRLWLPVASGAIALAGCAAFIYFRQPSSNDDAAPLAEVPASRPFALRPALVLAAVLTGALLVGRWGADLLGPKGAVLAALAAGLADAHAGALGAATLSAAGDITADTALTAIAAALSSNLIVKCVLAFTEGGSHFGLRFVAAMALPTAVFGTVMAVTIATR